MRKYLSSTRQIILSFFIVILTGSFLLNLNIAQVASSKASYFDHLFHAISMVCVTGLYTVPVVHTYSLFGQMVSLVLIQIGGLGLMTLIAVILLRSGRRLAHRDQLMLSEAINRETLSNLRPFLLSILKYTLAIESIGALILSLRFIPQFGWFKGIFTSLFIAVSAFCNAGYDNFSTISFLDYVGDPIISITIPFLIILGGIGFSIWFDLRQTYQELDKFEWSLYLRRLQVHTKLVLIATLFFITFGFLMTIMIEFNNSLAGLSFGQKLMASFFQSVTMRTAGFATIDYANTHSAINFIYILLMFVGGSPGGTAGGVKTTTVALVFLYVANHVRGRNQVNIFNRTISRDTLRNAMNVFLLYISVFMTALFLLLLLEPQVNFMALAFEDISALATVGVSMNLTPTLSRGAQVVIMALMFIGRVGPISLILFFAKNKKQQEITYAEGHVLIG